MSSNASKRKRVLITIDDKLKICEMSRQGVSKKVIMDRYNIGKSTLYDMLKNEEKFKKFKSDKDELGISSATKLTKRICTGNFEKLDNAL